MDIINDKRPRHTWSTKDRQILCLFTRIYQNSIRDATTVINHLLAGALEQEGYSSGLPVATVDTQLKSMTEGSAGHDVWRTIYVESSISEARRNLRELRDEIEDAALFLGLGLQLRGTDIQKPSDSPRRGRKRARSTESTEGVLGNEYSSNDETGSEKGTPRSKKRISTKSDATPTSPLERTTTQLLTPNSGQSAGPTLFIRRRKRWAASKGSKVSPVWAKTQELDETGRRFPTLLYRFHNSRSQGLNTPNLLLAGKFLSDDESIPPPEWNAEAISNHLIPKTLPSPYISFRESLRACLFRGLKTSADTNACVTVVDLRRYIATSRKRWGDKDAAHVCAALDKRFGLNLYKAKSYTGRGEWLLYGKVEKEAIVLTAHISDLLQYVNDTPAIANILRIDTMKTAPSAIIAQRMLRRSPPVLNFEAGKAVRDLANFLHIPDEVRDAFSAKLAASWHLRGSAQPKPNPWYEAFMLGVHAVDASTRPSEASNNRPIQDISTDDKFTSDEDLGNIMGLEDFGNTQDVSVISEQALIDAQLFAELSASSSRPNGALRVGTIPVDENDEALDENNPFGTQFQLGSGSLQSSPVPQNTPPRTSSPLAFRRPRIPGPATDWEATNSRDVSPAPTQQPALDTFTTELLAKAEECSTIGSFGRGPSTNRAVSEIQMAIREGDGAW